MCIYMAWFLAATLVLNGAATSHLSLRALSHSCHRASEIFTAQPVLEEVWVGLGRRLRISANETILRSCCAVLCLAAGSTYFIPGVFGMAISSQLPRLAYLILGYFSSSPHIESYYVHGGAFAVPQSSMDLLKRFFMNLRDFVLIMFLVMFGSVGDSYDLFHGDGSNWRLIYKPFWFVSTCAVMVAIGIWWPVGSQPTPQSIGLVAAGTSSCLPCVSIIEPAACLRSLDDVSIRVESAQ